MSRNGGNGAADRIYLKRHFPVTLSPPLGEEVQFKIPQPTVSSPVRGGEALRNSLAAASNCGRVAKRMATLNILSVIKRRRNLN